MATNLAIDDTLLERAHRISKLRTNVETVTLALTEFIQRRRLQQTVEAFGTFDFRRKWNCTAAAATANAASDPLPASPLRSTLLPSTGKC